MGRAAGARTSWLAACEPKAVGEELQPAISVGHHCPRNAVAIVHVPIPTRLEPGPQACRPPLPTSPRASPAQRGISQSRGCRATRYEETCSGTASCAPCPHNSRLDHEPKRTRSPKQSVVSETEKVNRHSSRSVESVSRPRLTPQIGPPNFPVLNFFVQSLRLLERGTSGSVQRGPANPARPGREQRYRVSQVCRGDPEVPRFRALLTPCYP